MKLYYLVILFFQMLHVRVQLLYNVIHNDFRETLDTKATISPMPLCGTERANINQEI
jgi:hypothetical protein